MGGRGRNARGVEGEGLLWVGRTGLEGGGTMQGAEGELEQAGEPLKAEVAAAEAEEPGEAKGLRCRTAEARVTRATARARAADGAAPGRVHGRVRPSRFFMHNGTRTVGEDPSSAASRSAELTVVPHNLQ